VYLQQLATSLCIGPVIYYYAPKNNGLCCQIERERERERERETKRERYLLKQSKYFTEKTIGFIEFSLKQKINL
jgi:hypothetical protein